MTMDPAPAAERPSASALSSTAQQFVAASAAIATAVDHIGARVEQLANDQSATASSVAVLSEKPGRAQISISIVALVVSLVTAVFTIYFGWSNTKFTRINTAKDGENSLRQHITDMSALAPTVQSPAGQAPNNSAIVKFYNDAYEVEMYRREHGFQGIDRKMFATLMRTVQSLPEAQQFAASFWASEKTVDDQKEASLDDNLDLAHLYAEYARLTKTSDDATKAAKRLQPFVIASEPNPRQKYAVQLDLAQVYAGVSHPDATSIESARRELTKAQELLAALKTTEPLNTQLNAQYDSQVTTLDESIKTLEKDEAIRRENAKRKSVKPPPPPKQLQPGEKQN
jgi:hypothetical protein